MTHTQAKSRARRTRATIRKVHTERPRLTVFRSNRYMSAQIIDDINNVTLTAVHVKDLEKTEKQTRMEQARALGKLIAERAKKVKIEIVVFDRGPYSYHGLVKSFADGARDGGLKF